MVEFVQRVQQQGTPNFTGQSQGIRFDRVQPDRSLATLFEGLGDAAVQAVTGADTVIQENIREEVAAGIESIDAEFGVDSATDFETGLFDTRQPVPAELRDSFRHLEGLQAQRQGGQLKEAHYWARAQSLVRQLRGRYPGYRHEIDQMVQSVTGVRPANALRRELMQEWGAGADEMAKRKMAIQERMSNSGILNLAAPDFWQREQAGNPYTYHELLRAESEYNKREAEIKAGETELTWLETQGRLTADQVQRQFRTEATSAIDQLMRSSAQVMGNLRELALEAQTAAAAGEPWDDQELAQLRPALALLRSQATQILEDLASREWEGGEGPQHTFRAHLDVDDLQKFFDEALRPIDELEKAITHKEWGAVTTSLAAMEARQNDVARGLIENHPPLELMGALREILGPETFALWLRTQANAETGLVELLNNIVEHNALLKRMQNGLEHPDNPSASDSLRQLRDSQDIPDNVVNQVTRGMVERWKNIVDRIGTEEGLPLNVLEAQVDFLFAPENYAIMSHFAPEQQMEYFRLMASPHVTQQLLTLRDEGNTDLWEKYQSWVGNEFQAQFRTAMNAVQDLTINQDVWQVDWNAQRHRFEFAFNPQLSSMERRNIEQSGELDRIRNRVDTLNRGIQLVAPVIESNDMDVSEQLFSLFNQMGYDPEAAPAEGSFVMDLMDSLQRAITTAGEDLGSGSPVLSGPRRMRRAVDTFWDMIRPFSPQFRAPEERGGTSQTGAAIETDFFDFVQSVEAPGGFDIMFGQRTPTHNLTDMTIREVRQLQDQWVAGGRPSSAAGGFQIIRRTLDEIMQSGNFDWDQKFDEQTQRELMLQRLRDTRGLDDWKAGRITDDQFLHNLSQEWAALPSPYTGRSYYHGDGLNRSLVSVDRVQQLLTGLVPEQQLEERHKRFRTPSGQEIGEIAQTAKSPTDFASAFIGAHQEAEGQVLQSFFEEFAGIGASPTDIAWCAAFANAVLRASGVEGTGSAMARSFLEWGTPTTEPAEGDIVVLTRGTAGWEGHVGFFAGYDERGNVKILGGNQGDAVSVTTFPRARVEGFRKAPNGRNPSEGDRRLIELTTPLAALEEMPLDMKIEMMEKLYG